MEILDLEIPDVKLIKPRVFQDQRGYFFESFRKDLFEEKVGEVSFVQENESLSSCGTLRGFHFQKPPFAQAKLVRVVSGEVLDVIIDLRPDSPTFGNHLAVELSGDNHHQLFVPRGFAHAFFVVSELAVFSYKVDNVYAPDYESGVRWDDSTIALDWPLKGKTLRVSEKDKQLPLLQDRENYSFFEGLCESTCIRR